MSRWSGLIDGIKGVFRGAARSGDEALEAGARHADDAPTPSPARQADDASDALARQRHEEYLRNTEEVPSGFFDGRGLPIMKRVPRGADEAADAAPAAGRSAQHSQQAYPSTVRGELGQIFAQGARHIWNSKVLRYTVFYPLTAMGIGTVAFIDTNPFTSQRDGGMAVGGLSYVAGQRGSDPLPVIGDNAQYQAGRQEYLRNTSDAEAQAVTSQMNEALRILRAGGPEADAILTRVAERTGIPMVALISGDPQTRLQAAPIFNIGNPDNETLAVRRLLAGGQEGGENMTMAQFTELQGTAMNNAAEAAINEQRAAARDAIRSRITTPGAYGPSGY